MSPGGAGESGIGRAVSGVVGCCVVLLLVLLTGCAARLHPPAEVADPVEVYLLDHGRHASLVVPDGDEGVVRYSYGDWQWYVEGRRHAGAALAAMLWPTRGALGRRHHPQREMPGELWRVAPEGVEQSYTLSVERERSRALRRRLDARHAAAAPAVESDAFDLSFVPHPRAYWLAHQSNLVVARWLGELGVTVRGIPWLSRWYISE